MYRNLPNLLSTLRLILVPFVAHSILSADFHRAAVLIFVAGCTDALDGHLARHFRWTSRIGAYLDPVADKLLLITTFVALGVQGAVPAWLVWLILGRDALILTMVAIALLFTSVRSFPPSVWGKLSTIVQVFTALAVIVDRAYVAADFHAFEMFIVAVTASATISSGVHYAWRAVAEFPAARLVHKTRL